MATRRSTGWVESICISTLLTHVSSLLRGSQHGSLEIVRVHLKDPKMGLPQSLGSNSSLSLELLKPFNNSLLSKRICLLTGIQIRHSLIIEFACLFLYKELNPNE